MIVGVLGDGTAGGETLVLAQTAATVFTVNDYLSYTTLTFPAADGTGATIAIGYGMGVHNSADVTNVLTATAPTHGTLTANDEWMVRTLGPAPNGAGITAAFTALATGPAASAEFRIVICDWVMNAALLANVSTGLSALAAQGKRCTAIFRSRIPNAETGETEAAWVASVAAEYLTYEDSRICWRAGYHLVTDAMTSRQYFRANLQQLAADVVRNPRALWPCAPADPGTGLGGEPNVSLVDADGVTVGHDEGSRGDATGLANDALGNRASCEMRIAESSVRESVFNTVPWVLYAADEQIRNLPTRRLVNAITSTAIAAGLIELGAHLFFKRLTPTTGTLTPASRRALQGSIYQAVSGEFGAEIENAADAAVDTGLVQISPAITISGGNLIGVSGTVNPKIGGFVISIALTLTTQE